MTANDNSPSPTSGTDAGETQVPAGAGSTELRLWVRLLACAKMGEKQIRRKFEDDFDTTLPRFDVLAALYRVPEGLQMSALSRALLVSNGNVTVIVRQLQEKGLVQTMTNPKDARSAIVSITEAGTRRFIELAEAHHSWTNEFFSNVPEGDKEELVRLLGQLRSVLMGDR
ncbi:MarR family winged helix-turn-helix transcriptional regulator [Aurantiacibacter rhizosphaerae]|uniref:MarR family transcriptional regulator n=1 Tax=Aurantiacibacter rhizosphaerae TaxID=2691582 RepID=A0A844XAB2_9SPHN|nr:MarR family transcriptional regulator [Aurantiacibacter rhizosphaerae]MWV26886.1 MarR family transcriptional regulator [Aurantiacibacter rhizosphaerae]